MNKAIEDYILQQKIGSGQYGNVYRAQHKTTKALFAVKIMNVEKFKQTPKLTEFVNNQINALSKISHPNIIRFVEMLRTSNNYYLVYEYCNGGTLSELLKKRGRLPQQQALNIMEQMKIAFAALYTAHLLHRDLKPTNILFNDGVLKLADFGFCKEMAKQTDMTQTMVGSPIYMAPEILKGLVYDARADIWSMGVILYEMLYGSCPFQENSIPKLITLIDNFQLNIPAEPQISNNTKNLIIRILSVRYRQRINPTQFINYDLRKKQAQPLIRIKGGEESPVYFKQAGKFIRKSLIYLTEALDYMSNQMDDIIVVRLSYMLYKIFSFIHKDTSVGGLYWANLNIQNTHPAWSSVSKQEMSIIQPLADITRQALLRQDKNLRTKVELQTAMIDSKYFLESVKRIHDDQMRNRLFNCLLFHRHFKLVMEKKPPDWSDPTSDKLNLKEKEEVCLKFARYY